MPDMEVTKMGKRYGYYYDRLRIITILGIRDLKKLLPITELEKNCESLRLEPSDKAKYWKYFSAIDVTAPNSEFLKLLLRHEADLQKYYISYLEITKDKFYRNNQIHKMESDFRHICRTQRKKWSGRDVKSSKEEPHPDSDFLGKEVLYFDKNNDERQLEFPPDDN